MPKVFHLTITMDNGRDVTMRYVHEMLDTLAMQLEGMLDAAPIDSGTDLAFDAGESDAILDGYDGATLRWHVTDEPLKSG